VDNADDEFVVLDDGVGDLGGVDDWCVGDCREGFSDDGAGIEVALGGGGGESGDEEKEEGGAHDGKMGQQ
jgi:hypothetical protein